MFRREMGGRIFAEFRDRACWPSGLGAAAWVLCAFYDQMELRKFCILMGIAEKVPPESEKASGDQEGDLLLARAFLEAARQTLSGIAFGVLVKYAKEALEVVVKEEQRQIQWRLRARALREQGLVDAAQLEGILAP
ncbi:hypothetical protein J1792_32215 [Streptomyces triculaminicus]|uniref:Uncharacterized protein n=1 Tax=Streptomyces triculaminicus TaxID=2816232 RepID=A0A939FV01_9ACTN|nr:hypothetical protein [Streptomyces triculaminicus]MBO0657213.1 hypothetical protein [Streptomyces triculaminicus]